MEHFVLTLKSITFFISGRFLSILWPSHFTIQLFLKNDFSKDSALLIFSGIRTK